MLSPFRMVCGDFILPESANYVSLFCFLNLRNLLYLIRCVVVRAADAYLRHVAKRVIREVVALPRERARADAAFACERRELAGRKECRSISCDILLQI